MDDLLLKLRKAVDRAIDARGSTKSILVSEFPAHVVKSLEAVLADSDTDRVSSRLAVLKAEVEKVVALTKESAGSAEDLATQRITVAIFEEPGLSARPKVESETTPAAAGSTTGSSDVAGPNGMLGKALDALRQEVAEIKRSLGADKAMHPDKQNTEDEDQQKAAADNEEEDQQKAKADNADEDDQVAKSVGWPLDMNRTMPGATPVEKRDPSLDWGGDPDKVAAVQG